MFECFVLSGYCFVSDLCNTDEISVIFVNVGVGCYGLANILLVYHKQTGFVGVCRELDLEILSSDKLEEVHVWRLI